MRQCALTILTQDNPAELWHLRHWLQFWQLRTWIHHNLCDLPFRSDTGQYLQFLRCLFVCLFDSSPKLGQLYQFLGKRWILGIKSVGPYSTFIRISLLSLLAIHICCSLSILFCQSQKDSQHWVRTKKSQSHREEGGRQGLPGKPHCGRTCLNAVSRDVHSHILRGASWCYCLASNPLFQILSQLRNYADNSVSLKGIVHQFFFRCSNLIFWIVMGCGIADFVRRGL